MGTFQNIKASLFDTTSSVDDAFYFEQIKKRFNIDQNGLYAGRILHEAYKLYPSNDALIDKDRSLNYKELFYRSICLSKKLQAMNVNKGDRVLLFCENSIELYIAYFAAWQVGAVVVPVNIFLHEKELVYIIQDSEPKLIVASSSLMQNIENLVIGGALATLPPLLSSCDIDTHSELPKTADLEMQSFSIVELGYDEMCTLLYTSGTTGTPKGVMLSSRNILTNTMQGYARFMLCGLTNKERFFCVLPLFHVFAQNTCLWLPVMTGSSVIIVRKIDRKLILEGLAKKPTVFFGFPALYGLLCLMKNAPLDSIKLFVSGADMLPDKIRAAFAIIYGRRICSGYGLSEASPVVGVNQQNTSLSTNIIGKPVAGLACDIRNEVGASVKQGDIGTLWIKGDNIMMGYYKSPESTNLVLRDGWLNTGDLASFDEYGNLAITGRIKDVIIHKGFNIYPAEIENILLMHPIVFKAAVIGHEEEASGQVPVAYVAVKNRTPDLEKALRDLCNNNLASYKIPRKFICLDDLPMNATGKVDKKQLRI